MPTARAQTPSLPKVGVLVAGTPDPAVFLVEFRKGLRDRGYIENTNIALEIRSAGSTNPAKLRQVAAELVQLKVAVLVAFQTPSAQAAKEAARGIPIVMAGVGDAVGSGLVASLARPGGNVTGISSATAESAGKLVELITTCCPRRTRWAPCATASIRFPSRSSNVFSSQVQRLESRSDRHSRKVHRMLRAHSLA
jgi:putative ABC transport system substrate-binding protein